MDGSRLFQPIFDGSQVNVSEPQNNVCISADVDMAGYVDANNDGALDCYSSENGKNFFFTESADEAIQLKKNFLRDYAAKHARDSEVEVCLGELELIPKGKNCYEKLDSTMFPVWVTPNTGEWEVHQREFLRLSKARKKSIT